VKRLVNFFNSVKLAVVLLTLTAATVLLGAWCPQEGAVGQEKIIEQFGAETASNLIKFGITDIFHTPYFLILIAFLTVNITVASFMRVFPRAKLVWQAPPVLGKAAIERIPKGESLQLDASAEEALSLVAKKMRRQGYVVTIHADKLTAEFGRFARLAASVTHVGLLTLLLGVTISSWTGFSGFKPVRLGESLSFADSEHSKLWMGKLPGWKVKVDGTRREDYPTGEAKQWYSNLTVLSASGQKQTTQEISVNNPLSYGGVDIYQSSWGMDQILVAFNGRELTLDLRPMGKRYAAFLPLDQSTILIFSVKEQDRPLRLFAKRPEWDGPKLIAQIPPGGTATLGSVPIKYVRPIPVTGLQYKCDPGLPIAFVAFGFIMLGVLLAAFPHRLIWVAIEPLSPEESKSGIRLYIAGTSNKAKVGFQRSLAKVVQSLKKDFNQSARIDGADGEGLAQKLTIGSEAQPAIEDRQAVGAGFRVTAKGDQNV
jgi:cytochrome c biogenesis protein